MKPNKRQLEAIAQLKSYGGAVITSQWTNGSGRYTTCRAVPPYCERVPRWAAYFQPERIKRVFRKHPKCEAVIAITNMRAVNKLLRDLN